MIHIQEDLSRVWQTGRGDGDGSGIPFIHTHIQHDVLYRDRPNEYTGMGHGVRDGDGYGPIWDGGDVYAFMRQGEGRGAQSTETTSDLATLLILLENKRV